MASSDVHAAFREALGERIPESLTRERTGTSVADLLSNDQRVLAARDGNAWADIAPLLWCLCGEEWHEALLALGRLNFWRHWPLV